MNDNNILLFGHWPQNTIRTPPEAFYITNCFVCAYCEDPNDLLLRNQWPSSWILLGTIISSLVSRYKKNKQSLGISEVTYRLIYLSLLFYFLSLYALLNYYYYINNGKIVIHCIHKIDAIFPKGCKCNGCLLSCLTSIGSWNGLLCEFSTFRYNLAL